MSWLLSYYLAEVLYSTTYYDQKVCESIMQELARNNAVIVDACKLQIEGLN